MQLTPSAAPLQFGWFPGGVEALILAILAFVVPGFLALWVLIDAKEQTDHPLAWGLAVLLGGLTPFYVGAIAVTILYHLSREELGSIPPPSVTNETVGRGEVLGDSARRGNEGGRAPRDASSAPAPRHDEQHGGDTVTGMGPDGQARWEGRVEAGISSDADDGDDEQEEAVGYDEATSMGEGEWSDGEPASADGGTTGANEASSDEPPEDTSAQADEAPPTDLGGFEMADPIEDTDEEETASEK